MIDYQTWLQIRELKEEGLSPAAIAHRLKLDPKTVAAWMERERYQPRRAAPARSKLDAFKPLILRLIELHAYTGSQIFTRIVQEGYEGGYTILTDYLRRVRPRRKPAFLKLHFEPGDCAQVDWGCHKSIPVGNTVRRLSFFVMVLAYSRRMYVRFTLGESQEQFLDCHRRAFEYFGAVPARIMVDNCKVAVLHNRPHQEPAFNPHYADFARHYGFKIVACGVRKPHEKGRVENGVGYVKKNLLAGHTFTDFSQINPAAIHWLDTVANPRKHRETGQTPDERFQGERDKLRALPAAGYDCCAIVTLRVSSQFRITWQTNRYSVPARHCGQLLPVKIYADKLCVYHDNQLIAQHPRSYERGKDFEDPDHVQPLLNQRRKARDQKNMIRFLDLCAEAADYHQQLQQRQINPLGHIRQIVALLDIYPEEDVVRALRDTVELGAYNSQYIQNLLEQRSRKLPQAGPLHLTRNQDLLELDLPEPDLGIYDQPDADPAAPSDNNNDNDDPS